MTLSESPFANPFGTPQQSAAADPNAVAAMPTAPVQAQALPAPAVASAPAPVTSSSGGWSAAGGTRITVASTDNLNAISQRYGVPTNAILSANGLSGPGEVQPGRQIVIPVYSASGQPAQIRTANAAPPPAAPTRVRIAGTPKPAAQTSADAGEKARTRPGMKTAQKPAPVRVAETQPAKATPAARPVAESAKPAPAAPAKVAAPKSPEPVPVAKVEPPAQKPAPVPSAASYAPAPAPARASEPTSTAGLPSEPAAEFRWPARGRVIAGFGANGGNEGINIAVPEGTPVKATEAGTVTYAGSEVRGYGNLVLIKHDNGYISAYAHNGELKVKRGERVTRGHVIAKSGQTGNVTSPQLHFEIRKGQAPVDPIPYLGGG